MYKVGAYLRLSKDDNDKGVSDSIENQKTLVVTYINQNDDMILVDIFIDDGYTGLNFERPGFNKMMEEVYKGNINAIITKDLSRLGRDHIETCNYIEKTFPANKVRYIAINDNYDSLSKSNEEMASFKALFNDYYARDISKKVKSAFDSKRKRGEFIGAFAPFGYKKHPQNNDLLVIDEYAANIVKRIFYLYLKGTSKLYIATILNNEGIPNPSNYKQQHGEQYKNSNKLESTSYWTYSTINKILHNEVYIGDMVQKKTEKISYKMKKKQTNDKSVWITKENTHEQIIDRETFEAVQKLLETQKRATDYNGNITIYAGILKCGDCGRAMSKTTSQIGGGRKADYYKCGTYKTYGKHLCTAHTIREDRLSDIVLKAIKQEAQNALNAKDISDLKSFSTKMLESKIGIIDNKALNIRLSKINKYAAQAYEDYADKLLARDEYILLKEKYAKEKEEIESQLQEIENAKFNQAELLSHHNEWINHFINYIDIDELTREAISELIDYIIVYENKQLEIKFKFESLF